ncbi:MAG: hypothetical protein WCK02_08805 [Bacteroidota bacterium]
MKTNKISKYSLSISYIIILLISACKKEETLTPTSPASQNPNNTNNTSDTTFIIDIKANGENCFYLTNKGTVFFATPTFSSNGTIITHHRIKGLSHIKKIAAAQYSTNTDNYEGMALDSSGTMFVWNVDPTVGCDSAITSPYMSDLGGNLIIDIAAGGSESGSYFVLDNNGDVWGWGDNSKYQMGNGTITYQLLPTMIGIPKGNVPATQLSAGTMQAIASTNSGLVYQWGTISFQTNEVYTLPANIASLSNINKIHAGDNYNLAFNSVTSKLYIWGHVTNGYIPDITNPKAFSAGAETYFNPMYILNDGTLMQTGFDMGTGNPTAAEVVPSLAAYKFNLLALSRRAFFVTNTGKLLVETSSGTTPYEVYNPFSE